MGIWSEDVIGCDSAIECCAALLCAAGLVPEGFKPDGKPQEQCVSVIDMKCLKSEAAPWMMCKNCDRPWIDVMMPIRHTRAQIAAVEETLMPSCEECKAANKHDSARFHSAREILAMARGETLDSPNACRHVRLNLKLRKHWRAIADGKTFQRMVDVANKVQVIYELIDCQQIRVGHAFQILAMIIVGTGMPFPRKPKRSS